MTDLEVKENHNTRNTALGCLIFIGITLLLLFLLTEYNQSDTYVKSDSQQATKIQLYPSYLNADSIIDYFSYKQKWIQYDKYKEVQNDFFKRKRIVKSKYMNPHGGLWGSITYDAETHEMILMDFSFEIYNLEPSHYKSLYMLPSSWCMYFDDNAMKFYFDTMHNYCLLPDIKAEELEYDAKDKSLEFVLSKRFDENLPYKGVYLSIENRGWYARHPDH